MAKGRQQKWVCLDCQAEFSVQGGKPRFCCACGSEWIGRAPSPELAEAYEAKRRELQELAPKLNEARKVFEDLKEKYDSNLSYWSQQKRRGYITQEEYDQLASVYDGAKRKEGTE